MNANNQADVSAHVAFDIGGTFTDLSVVSQAGVVHTAKLLSLTDRIGDDVVAAVRSMVGDEPIGRVVHGTTTCSNAIIEETTARIGLITTRGFRDIVELRGQRGPGAFLPEWDATEAMVRRGLREAVDERILADGSVRQALSDDEARAAIRRLLDQGVEAIAVCLLHSYENPVHELRIKQLIGELAPDLPCCASLDLDPAIGEYERTSTTVINAALMPIVSDYLQRISASITSLSRNLLIMQSNGGLVGAQLAEDRPAYLMESGPAAGVLAAARLARECELAEVISFDMGGTTAKACLIDDGTPLEKAGTHVGRGATLATAFGSGRGGDGHALRVPSLDIVEVGTGGGSIAWIDPGGALRVGPKSAGADPGPACYGRGGLLPTITDANLVLGYLNPVAMADSTLRLDADAAFRAVEEQIATPLGLSVEEAALGIIRVADAAMIRALRAVSTERGRDPRQCQLIAFGGAGPLHAARLASAMDMDEVHIPLHGGVFSSIGLLLADLRIDTMRSVARVTTDLDSDQIGAEFERLEDDARAQVAAQGVDPRSVVCERLADVRYSFQVATETIELDAEELQRNVGKYVAERFSEHFEKRYGYTAPDPIVLVNIRVRATAPAGRLDLRGLADRTAASATPTPGSRRAYFGPPGRIETVTHPVGLPPADCVGPAIIELPDTTIVVPPGWSAARREDIGSYVLRRGGAAGTTEAS